MKHRVYDTLIVGAGIYGINLARLLSRKYPEMKIAIFESNNSLFMNNSNHNSGVLHSGVYYKPGSLKAKFCVQGQKELSDFCEERGLYINRCGKLIVGTKDEYDKILPIYENGLKNGVEALMVDLNEAKRIDPFVNTDAPKMIYIPKTAIVKPTEVYRQILSEVSHSDNVNLNIGTKLVKVVEKNDNITKVMTDKGYIFTTKFIVNCSGPSSDKIAHAFNHGLKYRNISLKGVYRKIKLPPDQLPKVLVYPIPGPFSLGLHLTMENETNLKFGPSVDLPFFTLEDADRNWMKFFKMNIDLIGSLVKLKKWKELMLELRYNSFEVGLNRLSRIYNRYNVRNLQFSEKKVLIRTPAINIETGLFENDFIIEASRNNIHLLNFQSPAFTSFLPLSRHILEVFERNFY